VLTAGIHPRSALLLLFLACVLSACSEDRSIAKAIVTKRGVEFTPPAGFERMWEDGTGTEQVWGMLPEGKEGEALVGFTIESRSGLCSSTVGYREWVDHPLCRPVYMCEKAPCTDEEVMLFIDFCKPD
jgi:hypothetical protein